VSAPPPGRRRATADQRGRAFNGIRLEDRFSAAKFPSRAASLGAYVYITRLRGRSHIRSSDDFHPNDVGIV
jgi:hypothetical protein